MNEDEYSMDDDEYYPEFVELAANELKSTLQFKSSYKKSAQIMIAQISVKMLTDYDDKDMIGLCKAVLDMTARSLDSNSLHIIIMSFC
jgi:hypothetical protein